MFLNVALSVTIDIDEEPWKTIDTVFFLNFAITFVAPNTYTCFLSFFPT